MAGIELCKFTHGLGLYILRFYPSLLLGVKAQPMCKFAQLYACHELFLKSTPLNKSTEKKVVKFIGTKINC
jgi:hypothetical protein